MTNDILRDLEPQIVWNIFEQITMIPRPSKKEEQIRKWLIEWVKEHNLAYKTDEIGNLVIKKGASEGCQDWPILTLQGHMDMVCQKEHGVKIDFENDPIPIAHDDKIVYARGTSLGADNGVGVALALAILKDETLEHGPLEVLITVDEETGLTGAFAMEKGFFEGDYLLNIDSEEQGEITIGSAGGGGTTFKRKLSWIDVNDAYQGYKLKIGGLKGGHSGTDIHLPRANAIKLGAECLLHLQLELEEELALDKAFFYLGESSGGSAHNAIPRDAEYTFIVEKTYETMATEILDKWIKKTIEEQKEHEEKITIEYEPTEMQKSINEEDTIKILMLIRSIRHGPIKFSKTIKGLVQTSNNLAVMEIAENTVNIHCSTRSSVTEELEVFREGLADLGENYNFDVEQGEAYPGWKPEPDSAFTQLVKISYLEHMEKVELRAIHAGLECGLFLRLKPELQVTSIGPNIRNPHSPSEFVEIESVEIIWRVLKSVIRNISKLEINL